MQMLILTIFRLAINFFLNPLLQPENLDGSILKIETRPYFLLIVDGEYILVYVKECIISDIVRTRDYIETQKKENSMLTNASYCDIL